MIKIQIDEKIARTLIEKAINEKVEEIVKQKYFLTYNELAAYLNISKPIIEDCLIKNGMNYYKAGSKYLFRRDEVDEFLDGITKNMTLNNNDIKLFFQTKRDLNE